jgi:LytR cell envelope-related transcriptional attenuator
MTQSDPTNFFDDLEHQLVAATSDRPRRLRRARTRRLAALCTVLVALLAVGGGLAAALSNSTNNSDTGAPAARQHTPAPAPARTTPATGGRVCGRDTRTATGSRTVDPRSIEVAVLNGTTVPGLARGVANQLQNDRYKIGTVTNAATQDHAATQVFYGRAACRTAAILVAQAIDLMRIDTVGRMTEGVAVIAGGGADVAVVVGSDQNQSPTG